VKLVVFFRGVKRRSTPTAVAAGITIANQQQPIGAGIKRNLRRCYASLSAPESARRTCGGWLRRRVEQISVAQVRHIF
jgi:hypothetical protein